MEGDKKYSVLTETQREDINVARGIARNQNSKLLIHSKNCKKVKLERVIPMVMIHFQLKGNSNLNRKVKTKVNLSY